MEIAELVREAVNTALQGKAQKNPDFAVIHASSGSNMQTILDAAMQLLGRQTKIFGSTSDSRAVMTEKGFIKVAKRSCQLGKMGSLCENLR